MSPRIALIVMWVVERRILLNKNVVLISILHRTFAQRLMSQEQIIVERGCTFSSIYCVRKKRI